MTQAVAQVRNIVARSGFANPLTLGVPVSTASYVKVYADDTLLVSGSDYIITGIGDPNGVDIEIIGAEDVDNYVGTEAFTALFDPPLDQQGDLSAGGVLGRSFESALDQQNRRLQAVADRVARAPKVPPQIEGEIELPWPPVDGYVLAWDDDEQNFVWAPPSPQGPPGPSSPAVSVLDFNAAADGVTNDSAAFAAARAYAMSTNPPRPMYIPAGSYLLNTTFQLADDLQVRGDGPGSTTLIAGMTDGTPCVDVPAAAEFWGLSDIAITAPLNVPNFAAGTADPVNAIGFRAYNLSSSWPTRYNLSNVRIQGFALGAKIRGFIGKIDNVHIRYCELGFEGQLLNSVEANFKFEWNRKSFAISESDGLHLNSLLEQSVITGTVASTIDDCLGVALSAPYFEGNDNYPRTEPYLVVGGVSLVQSFHMFAANIVSGADLDFGVSPIVLDRVDGGYVDISIAEGAQQRTTETTANTRNLILRQNTLSLGMVQDASKGLDASINYFPNPNFDVWFRGWDTFLLTRATAAQETTLVRRGANAIKVLATAAQNFNSAAFRLTGEFVTALRGKTVRVGAWVWVPDIIEYDEANRDSHPGVRIVSYNGSVNVESTDLSNKMVKGAWNFFNSSVAVQSDATRITVLLDANYTSGVATGNEYIVVDSISIVEDRVSLQRQMEGEYRDSPLLPAFTNGRVELFASAAPTDTLQTYAVGDKVWKSNAAAGGSPGWVCTTAGAGGTAVFKAMANLAA